MANIRIQLDLTLPSFSARLLIIGALLSLIAPELGSESVTLSTYYPAPSGVYTNLITTNNTFLARDGGNVGIGTAAPGNKLDVVGNFAASGNAGVGGNMNITGQITAMGNANLRGNVIVGGGAGRGYFYINNTVTGCVVNNVVAGLVCGAGFYATFTPGFYVEGWSFQNRGGRVFAEGLAGQVSYQVRALSPVNGQEAWMTLNKNDSLASIYCCPKV